MENCALTRVSFKIFTKIPILKALHMKKTPIRNKTVLVFVIAKGCPCINQSLTHTISKVVPYYILSNSV